MSKAFKKRLFWIGFFIFFGVIMFLFPNKHQELQDKKNKVVKQENLVIKENSDINILIVSDGGINSTVYKDTEILKNLTTLLKENGFICEENCTNTTKTITQFDILKYNDLTTYNTYIFNLGYGDYLHHVPLYAQQSDTSFYYEVRQMVKHIKQKNKNAKIVFVTDKAIEHMTDKNNSGHTYEEYIKILKHICELDQLLFIDMYHTTKQNPMKIKENSIVFTLDEQDYIFKQIFDYIDIRNK